MLDEDRSGFRLNLLEWSESYAGCFLLSREHTAFVNERTVSRRPKASIRSEVVTLCMLRGLRDFHSLRTKDLGQIDRGMDLELHFSPVLDHGADVVMIFRLEHDHVGRVTAERSVETNSLQ